MAEIELTVSEASALDGTTDSETGFRYHSPGDANYYTEGQRQRQRLLTLAKALGNCFRVYKDGALTFGVGPGKVQWGASQLSYIGSTGNDLTDDATNFIYLHVSGGALTLGVSTSAFPDLAATPHVPLATIVAADGAYAYTDIADFRQVGAFRVVSAMTAAQANTLVGAGNADALHIHAAAGLASTLQDVVPYLAVTGADHADGTGAMTIQAKDAAGNNLAQRFRVRCWIAASEFAAPAAQTDFSVTTGTELREITADADYEAISDATGLVVMNIDTAANGTFYVMAEINGRIYTGSVAITGN